VLTWLIRVLVCVSGIAVLLFIDWWVLQLKLRGGRKLIGASAEHSSALWLPERDLAGHEAGAGLL